MVKGADDIGDERGDQESARKAEDGVIGGLILPVACGRNQASGVYGDDHQEVCGKAGPDDAARSRIPVDLREHVADDVAERENDDRRRDNHVAYEGGLAE